MPCFRPIFLFESGRFFLRKKIAIIFVILLISLSSGQKGIKENNLTTDKIKEFQNIEVQKFNAMNNYDTISHIGSRILFMPAPVAIFFTNPPVMTEISARINTVANLDISSNCQSKSIFITDTLLSLRFSNVVFFLGTLAALLFGFQSMKDKEYLKFIARINSRKRVYLAIFFSRYILIVISFLFIFSCTVLLAIIEGIPLSWADIISLIPFLVASLLLLLFCLAIGTIPGHWVKKGGLAIILLLWAVIAIAIPLGIAAINEDNADAIPSSNKLFGDKLKVSTDFEKMAAQKYGKFKDHTRVSARKVIEIYWDDHYPQMDNLEDSFKNEMKQVNKKNNALAICFPTTFYHLTTVESSSRGFQGFMDFYDYLQDLRRNYLRFWLNHVFYADPKILVNFIEGDMNIFKSKSRLPENYNAGILITLFYILAAIVGSYYSFQKSFKTPLIKKTAKKENFPIELKKGKVTALVLYVEIGLDEKLYNLLDGIVDEYNENIRITLDGVDITGKKQEFFYVPQPEELPDDIKVEEFISYCAQVLKLTEKEKADFNDSTSAIMTNFAEKTFGQLDNYARGRVLVSVLPYFKSQIYLVNNIAAGLPPHFILDLNDLMCSWAEAGAAVLYLTTNSEINVEKIKAELSRDFDEMDEWSSAVKVVKKVIKNSH